MIHGSWRPGFFRLVTGVAPVRSRPMPSLILSHLRQLRWLSFVIVAACCLCNVALCQRALSWAEVRERFEAANPTLRAVRIGIEESRANEITAYLKPNPDITVTLDQLDPFTTNPYRPFANTLPFLSGSYHYEREHKRELRRDSARQATGIAASNLVDQERTLIFSLRNAFVQTLQAKAVLQLTQDNLAYYDQLLGVNRTRRQAGDISQVDLDRLELQRVQYESDREAATVNLRTAKIQLLALLNDRTPVDQFDVTGPFDSRDPVQPLEEFRRVALESRPDLKAAAEAIAKAKIDHRLAVANGSADPTFSLDFGRNPPIPAYFGVSVTIPLRIHDRNQGEKIRTELDVARNERLRDASEAQVYSDVDSAYATLNGALTLLRSFKAQYLQQAVKVRDTISFSYQNGGASLLDFLNAQNDYRNVQLSYLNLIGSYMKAASQMNLAVGREVIP
jgi:outer membrane protein, heavy metal efflux system